MANGTGQAIMKFKTEMVRDYLMSGNVKMALWLAKDFRINVTSEQRKLMSRAYECIVYPDFYKQIGIEPNEAIAKGEEVVRLISGI